jgi:glycosyltransferase involved in cell wall biosynthesis
MVIDVIILSYAKDPSFEKMNLNCMKSIYESSTEHKFQIYLIETNKEKEFIYEGCETCKVIQPNEEFNYNRFLNIGLENCTNDWVLISNNDTIYHKGFLEEMLKANEQDPELFSMSPMDDNWHRHKLFSKTTPIHYGHRTSYEIAGWSIFVKRDILKKMNGFDEKFKFWYQDNDYALTLQKYKLKHALITNSKVTHLLSKSHNLIEPHKKFQMTDGMVNDFKNKWYVKR